ncbi:MAG: LysM peptidoglycan-binding domain-containing protein [Gemmatimonadota bacterium]
MGLFDSDKEKAKEKKKEKADFSNVRTGSSSTAPEARPTAGAATGQSYTVKSGDTLWAISKRFYGDGAQWSRIHEANRNLIKDPDVIQPGWVLTIPGETVGGAR